MVYLLTLSHMPNFNTLSHQTVKKHSHDCLVILHSIDILTHSFPMSCRTLLQGHRVNFLVSLPFQISAVLHVVVTDGELKRTAVGRLGIG